MSRYSGTNVLYVIRREDHKRIMRIPYGDDCRLQHRVNARNMAYDELSKHNLERVDVSFEVNDFCCDSCGDKMYHHENRDEPFCPVCQ